MEEGIRIKTPEQPENVQRERSVRGGLSLLNKIPTRRQFVGGGDKDVNEFIKNLRERISEELGDNSIGLEVQVFEFLKTEFPHLSYSYIVIAAKYKEEVGYFVSELAATGVPGLSPSAILAKLESKNPRFTIPGNAIEPKLISLINSELSQRPEYQGLKIKPMGGIIVFDNVDLKDELVAAEVAGTGVSLLSVKLLEDAGEFSDLDIVSDVVDNGMQIDINTMSTCETAISAVGDTRYVTFDVSATLFNPDHKGGPNDEGSDIFFEDIKGNIQLLPVEEPVVVRGEEVGSELKFAPMIVLNAVDALYPTGGMTAFGIYLANQMNVNYKWLEVLINNAGPGRDPGNLLKLITDENGKPLPPVPFSKQKKKSKILEIAREFLLSDPLLILDVPAFGSYSAQLAKYQVAASNSKRAKAAQDSIARDWYNITDETLQISGAEVVHPGAVRLPYGTFTDKMGETRSLDEINLMYLVESDTNLDLAYKLVEAELGQSDVEPFEALLEIYDELGLKDVKIQGIKYRVILHGEAIELLMEAIESVYDINADKGEGIKIGETHGFGYVSDIYRRNKVRKFTYSKRRPSRREFAYDPDFF